MRTFLLSPANCRGKRAAHLFRDAADFDLAVRLRTPEGAPLADVFSFVSGLYFRGKAAYARAFARPADAALVITGGRGLLPLDAPVTLADLLAFRDEEIDASNPAYREPLVEQLAARVASAGRRAEFVLLGSLATRKYLDPLGSVLGSRLLYPEPFLGMGDMQRGALMLRAVSAGVELPYARAVQPA